ALNCRGHFAYPAFAPIILNIGLIIAALLVAPALGRTDEGQFLVIAVALSVTGVVQLVGVIWLLRRYSLLATPKLTPVLPEIKRTIALMGPMLIPLSVLQFSALADTIITLALTGPGLPLQPGVVRCHYAAGRLYQLPMGVLAISIATVVFPLFSRYASRNDTTGLRNAVNRALRLCLFLGIPAGVALIILAEPVVAMIFQRRNFTAFDTGRATLILQMYCLGMGAYFCNHILLRAFFARKDTRVPLLLACVLAVVNMGLVIGGMFTPLKSGAIGAATAATSTLNAAALVFVLRHRLGGIGGRRLLISALRTAVACAAMVAAIWSVLHFAAPAEPWKIILFCVPTGAAAFLVSAVALRCPELPELLKRKRME
ncbi:MAG: oligosaccharide flippase family protein, partial [Phycisphaerae bacterium]|nr:oligosaccharide flippase family protein [Phycisphaerae bacterium]